METCSEPEILTDEEIADLADDAGLKREVWLEFTEEQRLAVVGRLIEVETPHIGRKFGDSTPLVEKLQRIQKAIENEQEACRLMDKLGIRY